MLDRRLTARPDTGAKRPRVQHVAAGSDQDLAPPVALLGVQIAEVEGDLAEGVAQPERVSSKRFACGGSSLKQAERPMGSKKSWS